MATSQYIGARYVPLFAEPVEWNAERTYEPLTIVLHEGNSYTSRQFVPHGVDLDNSTFWALTGNYNAQVEQYRRDVNNINDTVNNVIIKDVNKNAEDIKTIESYLKQFYVTIDMFYGNNDTDKFIAALTFARKHNCFVIVNRDLQLDDTIELQSNDTIIGAPNVKLTSSKNIFNIAVPTNGAKNIIIKNVSLHTPEVGVNVTGGSNGLNESEIHVRGFNCKTTFYSDTSVWNCDLNIYSSHNTDSSVVILDGFNNFIKCVVFGNPETNYTVTALKLNCSFTGVFDIEDYSGKLIAHAGGFYDMHIQKLHIERCTGRTNYGAWIDAGDSFVKIDSCDVYNSTIDVADFFNLVLLTPTASSKTSAGCVVDKAYCLEFKNKKGTFNCISVVTNACNFSQTKSLSGFDKPYYNYGVKDNCFNKMQPVT